MKVHEHIQDEWLIEHTVAECATCLHAKDKGYHICVNVGGGWRMLRKTWHMDAVCAIAYGERVRRRYARYARTQK